MASKVEILLKARDGVTGAVGKANSAIKGFGAGIGKMSMMAKTAWAAVIAAIVAGAGKLAAMWDKQVQAERRLATAHKMYGENAARYVAAEKKIAASIQDEIGVGDEQTLALMARLRLMGVAPAQMERAAKATHALAAVGMDEAAASRAVSQALQGNFNALARLSPEIRNAKTDAEKLAAFNRLVAIGYQQLQGDMESFSGASKALKGRLGDLGEQMGRLVNYGNWMGKTISWTADMVKRMTDNIDAALGKEPAYQTTAADIRKDEDALKRVESVYQRLLMAKKQYAERGAAEQAVADAEKEKKAHEANAAALEKEAEKHKQVMEMTVRQSLAARKAQEEEAKRKKREEKDNARLMKNGLRLEEMERTGARLTKSQQRKLAEWRERQEVFGWDAATLKARAKREGGIVPGANEGLVAKMAVAQNNAQQAAARLPAMQDALAALPTAADLKAEIAALEKSLADAKAASDLYQRNAGEIDKKMLEKAGVTAGFVKSVDQTLQGVSDYLQKNLEGV